MNPRFVARALCVFALISACSASPDAAADASPEPSQSSVPPTCPPAPGPAASSAIVDLGPTSGLTESPAAGERLVLSGIVLYPDCAPARRTAISWWHTDAVGHYGPDDPSGRLICCYYAAAFATDGEGRFEIRTVRPATDPAPDAELPAHIHIAIGTLAVGGPDVGMQFADDPNAIGQERGPRDILLEVARRTDELGEYWIGYVQIIASPPD